jgi:NAD(P)H dehydrogenase (quinone)
VLARVPSSTEIRIADYGDVSALTTAFQSVDTLFVVPSDGFATSVLRHMRNVIEAATISRVGRIVLLSIVDVAPDSPFYFAPVYREAEARILDSGLRWTILRSGLYADLIRDSWLAPSTECGVVSLPATDARVAPISRDEVALATTHALLGDLPGQVLNLTGPDALSFEDLAQIFSQAQGVPLKYAPIQPADYLLRLWEETQDPWPHAFSSLLASICQGRFGNVSQDFQSLTGRPPVPFIDCLAHQLRET